MTLSVGAITNRYNSMNNLQAKKAAHATPSFGQRRGNGLRNAAIATMIAIPTTALVTSCDDDWFNHSEAWAVAINKDSCGCCGKGKPIHTRDTIYLPGDTVYQIVDHYDTIKIKDDFHSPVIDTINAILDDVGVDRGGKYLPLKISYIDEMDTKYKRYLMDEESQPGGTVIYNGTKSPFDDDQGQFIIGTPLDEREKVLASLTSDGKLYLMKMIPKNGVSNPKGLEDFMVAPQSIILDRQYAKKLINRLGVYSDKGGRENLGTMEQGEIPKSVKITNPYGTTWRYTNLDVLSKDPEELK
ncbi:hypothetical protein IKP85_02860 [bacterium]|nr:hypothetical protein [bacterium]